VFELGDDSNIVSWLHLCKESRGIMRECFVHRLDRDCPDIAAFWHRLTQNYNGRNLFSNPNQKLGGLTPSRDLRAGLETNAVRPPKRIRVAQTAFILFSTFLDLRPVSDASD
jgi:hypothetical protein